MRAEESRVLVVAPMGQDAQAVAGILREEGLGVETCAGMEECLERLEAGAGALLLTEEALELPGAEGLLEAFRLQPAWSELPLIILTSGGDSRFARLLEIAAEVAGTVTLLERPMRMGTLLHSVRVALRSRRRQYQVRELLAERERREAALRESEERFRSLADGTPVLIWVHDAEGGLRFVNRAWSEFFGKTLEQVRGENWRPLMHAEDVPGYVEGFLRCHVQRGEFHAQARVQRHDGQWRWMESFGAPRFSGTGEYLGMAGSSVDISARKEAEAVLARDKEELERLVAERTRELRELVGELEHFSYSITHDMRAPLRAMMGFAEVVKELCSGGGHEQQQVFLERIQTAARRMDLLITDALNYSKAVRSELPLAPVDLGRLLREMVDTYPELQLTEGRIWIDPGLPLVIGNEAGLTQCFSNLLVNAVKFARPGEEPQIRVRAEFVNDLKLTADKAPAQRATPNSHQRPWVRVWVEDCGIGIAPQMLPRVFDMFARGASKEAGTGIGLALVRKVVDRMGGRVGVESEVGRGSRFWVELRSGEMRGRG